MITSVKWLPRNLRIGLQPSGTNKKIQSSLTIFKDELNINKQGYEINIDPTLWNLLSKLFMLDSDYGDLESNDLPRLRSTLIYILNCKHLLNMIQLDLEKSQNSNFKNLDYSLEKLNELLNFISCAHKEQAKIFW